MNTTTLSKVEIKAIVKSEQHAIEQINEMAGQIAKNVVRIGQIIGNCKAKYGDSFTDKLDNLFPKSMWRNCEAAACGILDPRLVIMSGRQYQRLRRYPKPVQTKLLDKGAKVLIGDGDHLMVSIDNLTADQIDQVFDYDGIRDLAAQRSFIESRNARRTAEAKRKAAEIANAAPDWEVVGGKLVIHRAEVRLTKAQVIEILGEMVK